MQKPAATSSTTQPNQVDWRNGQPYSSRFDDVYFSTDAANPQQGVAETHYVFLQHNQLEKRWKQLQQPTFTIAETGFGTGLNFLCAVQLWLETAPLHCRLHFISLEKYPLPPSDMQQAHQNWPNLLPLSQSLLKQYGHLTEGIHRISLFSKRVQLTLVIGDIASKLPQLRASVDAWFLDGFSPAKNPEMWQPLLYEHMARLSHQHTTFATFTSAGFVKRGLTAQGFITYKAAGFGRKREMLYGQFKSDHAAVCAPALSHIVIIGAGIAGCATAYALAQRGLHVLLLEQRSDIALAASGNPKGVLYPRLGGTPNAQDRIAMASFLYSLRLYKQLALPVHVFQDCGLLQLGFNAKETERVHAIAQRGLAEDVVRYVDHVSASRLAGVSLNTSGLYFPSAGWVNPQALCAALVHHPHITLKTHTQVLKLTNLHNQWQVHTHQDSYVADAVVIANAHDAVNLTQSAHLPLKAVRGQMTRVKSTPDSQLLNAVVCTDGYITPAEGGEHCVGATFSADDISLETREADNAINLTMAKKLSPQLSALATQAHCGRAALRCSTTDYLPLVGQLLDAAALSHNPPKHKTDATALPWHHGLFVNVAHGSKGLITAPLCAELLACRMTGDPFPVEADLALSLDANRFLLRDLGLKRLVNRVV